MELENEKRHSAPVETVSTVAPQSLPTPAPETVAVAKPKNVPAELQSSTMASNIPPHPTDVVPQNENKSIHPTATLPVMDRPDKASKLVPEGESGETTDKNKSGESKKEDKPSTPKVESFAAAVAPSTADVGSRFYIKRRIIVGNVSKYMAPGM